ncbi:hypothetical protein D5H75_36155 [Bailinhaonella thermotolerans]|uniref:Uncharacterized protein n=1 Tax=Bailinhaonella thermotolerans TaxID=1070861 RepID=A0A3A4A1J7_9ACTN|nr:hypothetical protein D5H75_36155 [Bailinhaonella thermotolerans]
MRAAMFLKRRIRRHVSQSRCWGRLGGRYRFAPHSGCPRQQCVLRALIAVGLPERRLLIGRDTAWR